jgi:hypothetical protein
MTFTISLEELNKYFGNPIYSIEMNKLNTFNNFNTITMFEKTDYYTYWIKRIKDEEHYINNSLNVSLDDIRYLNNRKRNILRCMNKMRQKHTYIHKFKNNCIKNNIGNDIGNDIDNTILITEYNFSVEIPKEYSIEYYRK